MLQALLVGEVLAALGAHVLCYRHDFCPGHLFFFTELGLFRRQSRRCVRIDNSTVFAPVLLKTQPLWKKETECHINKTNCKSVSTTTKTNGTCSVAKSAKRQEKLIKLCSIDFPSPFWTCSLLHYPPTTVYSLLSV